MRNRVKGLLQEISDFIVQHFHFEVDLHVVLAEIAVKIELQLVVLLLFGRLVLLEHLLVQVLVTLQSDYSIFEIDYFVVQ